MSDAAANQFEVRGTRPFWRTSSVAQEKQLGDDAAWREGGSGVLGTKMASRSDAH